MTTGIEHMMIETVIVTESLTRTNTGTGGDSVSTRKTYLNISIMLNVLDLFCKSIKYLLLHSLILNTLKHFLFGSTSFLVLIRENIEMRK